MEAFVNRVRQLLANPKMPDEQKARIDDLIDPANAAMQPIDDLARWIIQIVMSSTLPARAAADRLAISVTRSVSV